MSWRQAVSPVFSVAPIAGTRALGRWEGGLREHCAPVSVLFQDKKQSLYLHVQLLYLHYPILLGRCIIFSCHNQLPQTRWLKKIQKFILRQFWRPKVWTQDISWAIFPGTPAQTHSQQESSWENPSSLPAKATGLPVLLDALLWSLPPSQQRGLLRVFPSIIWFRTHSEPQRASSLTPQGTFTDPFPKPAHSPRRWVDTLMGASTH